MAAFIEVNLKGFDRATKRMIRAGANVRPAFQKSRRPLRTDTRDHMKSREGVKKRKWAPLAPSTRARRLQRIRRGAVTKTKRGRLKKKVERRLDQILSKKMITARNSKIKIGRRFISIRSEVGRAQQKGLRVGNRAKLPKREFLYFSADLQASVRRRIANHLKKSFEGK